MINFTKNLTIGQVYLGIDLLLTVLRKLENKSFIRRIHQMSTHSFVNWNWLKLLTLWGSGYKKGLVVAKRLKNCVHCSVISDRCDIIGTAKRQRKLCENVFLAAVKALIKRERKSSQVDLWWLALTPVKRRHKSSQVLHFRKDDNSTTSTNIVKIRSIPWQYRYIEIRRPKHNLEYARAE